MPYETEDEAGWNALPDVSDDQDVPVADSIGPLHTGSEPYSYRLQQYDRTLTIVSQPDKGLSFQIWPSAISLSAYAELQDLQQRGYWKVLQAQATLLLAMAAELGGCHKSQELG